MELSIVIPIYNEDKNILPLYSELKIVLDNLKKSYEIIFIDDGSTDTSYNILTQIHQKDKKVKIIKFRKNFGQASSTSCGFMESKGKILIVMDGDLQNNPKDIPTLLNKLKEGYDVVTGWRYKRKDVISKRVSSLLSNLLIRIITKEDIHDSGCSLRVYRRVCLNDCQVYGEMHRFIPLILIWKGYKIKEIKVDHRPRIDCKTKYKTDRILRGLLDFIMLTFWMRYSTKPIHLFGKLGLLCNLVGFVLGTYLVFIKFKLGMSISDRPLLFLVVLLIFLGTIFFLFGILTDILLKLYYKDEKTYSIEKIISG